MRDCERVETATMRTGPARIAVLGAAEAAPLLCELGVRPAILTDARLVPWATALAAAWARSGVRASVRVLAGACGEESCGPHVRALSPGGGADADAVVAVGGGTVLDAGKIVAQRAGVSMAAVPTCPSTCAAWTAVAAAYSAEGVYVGPEPISRGPELLVFDETLLSAAPARLVRAGLADTLAKAVEAEAAGVPEDRPLASAARWTAGEAAARVRSAGGAAAAWHARRAGDAIPEDGALGPFPDAGEPPPPAVRAVHEAIVLLSGLASGIGGDAMDSFAAHPVADALTEAGPFRALLHGERVALGLLAQAELTGTGRDELIELYGAWGLSCLPDGAAYAALQDDVRARVCASALSGEQSLQHHLRLTPAELDAAIRSVRLPA